MAWSSSSDKPYFLPMKAVRLLLLMSRTQVLPAIVLWIEFAGSSRWQGANWVTPSPSPTEQLPACFYHQPTCLWIPIFGPLQDVPRAIPSVAYGITPPSGLPAIQLVSEFWSSWLGYHRFSPMPHAQHY